MRLVSFSKYRIYLVVHEKGLLALKKADEWSARKSLGVEQLTCFENMP